MQQLSFADAFGFDSNIKPRGMVKSEVLLSKVIFQKKMKINKYLISVNWDKASCLPAETIDSTNS